MVPLTLLYLIVVVYFKSLDFANYFGCYGHLSLGCSFWAVTRRWAVTLRNTLLEEPINTRGMAYDKDAMAALLEEPTIEQPVIVAVEIPKANDVFFITKKGVGGDGENR